MRYLWHVLGPGGLGFFLAVSLVAGCVSTVYAADNCYGDDCGTDARPYVTPRAYVDPFEQARQNEAREYRNQHPLHTYETPLATPPPRAPQGYIPL